MSDQQLLRYWSDYLTALSDARTDMASWPEGFDLNGIGRCFQHLADAAEALAEIQLIVEIQHTEDES